MRFQQNSLSSQQQMGNQQTQQQDDVFTPSTQFTNNQGGFRFGNQNSVAQPSQPSTAEEFPPLNRNMNGDIGQDRSSSMVQNVGFGAQPNGHGAGFGSSNAPSNRSNGLLNALSGSNRVPGNRVSSPSTVPGERTCCVHFFLAPFLLTLFRYNSKDNG